MSGCPSVPEAFRILQCFDQFHDMDAQFARKAVRFLGADRIDHVLRAAKEVHGLVNSGFGERDAGGQTEGAIKRPTVNLDPETPGSTVQLLDKPSRLRECRL